MASIIPLYETDADLKAEAEIASLMAVRWNCERALKLGMAYGLDFALIREGEVVAFLEAKDRHPNLAFGTPGGYYLSLLKAMRAAALTDHTGLPCFLAIRFNDGLVRWCDFKAAWPDQLIVHGRSDRPLDPGAYEPCVVFPWNCFSKPVTHGPAQD